MYCRKYNESGRALGDERAGGDELEREGEKVEDEEDTNFDEACGEWSGGWVRIGVEMCVLTDCCFSPVSEKD